MSLIIAIALLSSLSHGGGAGEAPVSEPPAPTASSDAARSAGLVPARRWLALVDDRRWDESWRTASRLFNTQITAAQWATTIQSVRQPLGAVVRRSFQTVSKTTSLPGAPTGNYEIIEFRTDFARRNGAVETVVVMRQGAGWKVSGYFIR